MFRLRTPNSLHNSGLCSTHDETDTLSFSIYNIRQDDQQEDGQLIQNEITATGQSKTGDYDIRVASDICFCDLPVGRSVTFRKPRKSEHSDGHEILFSANQEMVTRVTLNKAPSISLAGSSEYEFEFSVSVEGKTDREVTDYTWRIEQHYPNQESSRTKEKCLLCAIFFSAAGNSFQIFEEKTPSYRIT